MRDINELIGLIKGISFDGIVNSKEVERLQEWVNKNRNLAYESYQIDLIRIVDSVLEDNIIDNDEKDALLEAAEHVKNEQGNIIDKLFELNGIIEGVICDDVVNEAEIYRLKDWMDKYGDLIREQPIMVGLCKAIDEVLEDGIVTPDEQLKILDVLKKCIVNTQFESKLEYLCGLVREKKNIGVELIDLLDNDYAITEIHKRAEKELDDVLFYGNDALFYGNSYIIKQEIIVISLVLIAMMDYDGNFYGNVRNTYRYLYSVYSEQKVEGQIRTILNRFKKQNDEGSRTRIINVALENAIVPQAFLPAFFDFIFDIYKLNFEYDISDDLYEDFLFVYEGLQKNMLSDGDVISLNVTQKTYKLIASTKKLLSRRSGLDPVIKLSILIIKLIDKWYWNKDVQIYNPYLKAGYEKWESQLKENEQTERKQRSISEFRSKWEPKFILRDNKIYIDPPVHRIKAQYDYRDITVLVSNGEQVLYSDSNCFIKEIIGGYQLCPPNICVDNPIGEVTYRIVAGDEIIYDSKTKLYRNYFVFNELGRELVNNTDYEGTAYICYKENEADIKDICKHENYNIGYMLARIGDALRVGNDVFNFSSLIKPGVFGIKYEDCYVSSLSSDEMLPVYKQVDVLVFEADCISDKFEVLINNKPYKLSDLQCKVTERESITKYVINLDLNNSDIYSIKVNQFVTGKKILILDDTFAYDKELIYSAELNENEVVVNVESDLMGHELKQKLDVKDYNPCINHFFLNGEEYIYYLPFNLGLYCIDGGQWNKPEEELWIGDISLDSTLEILTTECDSLILYNDEGVLVEDNIQVKRKGVSSYVSLGFLNSYKSNKYTMLVFTLEGKRTHTLMCYNKCVLEEEQLAITHLDEPKKILITLVFHGKNKVFVEVFNSDNEKVFTSNYLESGDTVEISDFDSFEEYTFNFHEKTNALMLRKNSLLLQVKKTFYIQADFVGHGFKIDTAYYDQFNNGKTIEKSYYFNKAYVRFTKMLDRNLFEGHIFVKTFKGKWYLNRINPVEVEICSEIIDDTLDVYMTNCKDGLLMDFKNHGILNAMEHPTAPDIFLFTLSIPKENR